MIIKSIILLIASVITLYLLKRMNRESMRSVVSSVSAVVVIAFFCSGLYLGKFLKSLEILASIEKNDYSHFLDHFDKHYDPKAINCITENAMDNDVNNAAQKIQLPPSGFKYYTESLYNREFVFSATASRGWMFSTYIYENALKKISLLVGKSAYNRIFDSKEIFPVGKFPFAKGIMDDRFIKEYNTMSKNQLKITRNKAGLRFYLVENKRDELSQALSCIGNLYHVYDLTKL